MGFAREGCQPRAEEEGRCLRCSPCHIPAASSPLPLPAFPAPCLPMASAPPGAQKPSEAWFEISPPAACTTASAMRNHLLPRPAPFLPPPRPPLSSQGMFSHQLAGQLWPQVPLPRAAGVKGRLAKHLRGKGELEGMQGGGEAQSPSPLQRRHHLPLHPSVSISEPSPQLSLA